MTDEDRKAITAVTGHLQACRSIFVVTGAGVSADSGLPTYRGIGGLYNDRFTEDDVPIEVALSGPMFASRPEITWKYLAQIERTARGATFNRAHRVLAEMETHFSRFWILTQNIDGFHSRAGSKNVIEIHGNMHRLRCTACSRFETWTDYSELEVPPTCTDCGKMMRPDVVLFEEPLPEQAVDMLYEQTAAGFDLVMSIGTSSNFPYIATPVLVAQKRGVTTVEINPGTTPLSDIVDYRIELGAADALGTIWDEFRKLNDL